MFQVVSASILISTGRFSLFQLVSGRFGSFQLVLTYINYERFMFEEKVFTIMKVAFLSSFMVVMHYITLH